MLQPAPEALFYTGFCIFLAYYCGCSVLLLLRSATLNKNAIHWAPILGVAGFSTLMANLNYLRVPGGIAALITFIAFSVPLLLRRNELRDILPGGLSSRRVALASLAIVIGFIIPYALTRGFFFAGDALTYIAIADFLKMHHYFSNAEPAYVFPWQSQMLLYQLAHLRMGAQYFLSGVSSLLGIDPLDAYVPVTATAILAMLSSFWLFSSRFFERTRLALICFLIFGLNTMLVIFPATQNFLPQTFGMAMLLAVLTLTAEWRENLRDIIIALGFMWSALWFFYAEVAPFILLMFGLYFAIEILLNWSSAGRILKGLAGVAIAAVLINGYSIYYTVQSIPIQFRSRPGGDIRVPLDDYLMMAFGLRGMSLHEPAMEAFLHASSLVFGAITLLGLLYLLVQRRHLIVPVVASIFFAAAVYTELVTKYLYGLYKIGLYSYFLVPICFVTGLLFLSMKLPTRVRGLLVYGVSAFVLFSSALHLAGFYSRGYEMERSVLVPPGQPLDDFIHNLRELRAANAIVQTGQKTLLLIPVDYENAWSAYFFRKPVGLYYITDVFNVLKPHPLSDLTGYDYYILSSRSSSLAYPDKALIRNRWITFTEPQPFLDVTKEGWHQNEIVNGKNMRWMEESAKMRVFVPDATPFSLHTFVYLGPGRATKHLRLLVDGHTAQSWVVSADHTPVITNPLSLHTGFHTLTLETDEKAQASPTDPRRLNLLVEKIEFSTLNPVIRLDMAKAHDREVLKGITPDGWLTKAGIDVSFSTVPKTTYTLELSGSLPGHKAIMPQILDVQVDDSPMRKLRIGAAGNFKVALAVESGDRTGIKMHISPERTIVPRNAGINDDPRQLGAQLTSVGFANRSQDCPPLEAATTK